MVKHDARFSALDVGRLQALSLADARDALVALLQPHRVSQSFTQSITSLLR